LELSWFSKNPGGFLILRLDFGNPIGLSAVFVGVMLAGFFSMHSGVNSVAMRNMRVVASRFVVAFFVMLGSFQMVGGRFLVVLGGFLVVFGTFMGHANFPFNN
jgi:hypothetical protein